ncbi:SMC-Scp complex subunit ScpB [Granulicella arctica]|uniref:SMC-Scp complex subunit ScpB n=1 Tax=Granulicella arctica TaxID=940613 RepID=UPI0021DF5FB6|nr:SMC-Scp complex subunit ScpB [Granulicella arctica]
MSLKAKIEAVIYASEEPVTLVQLAGLLGHEAQAELDHHDSAQRRLLLDDPEEIDTPADADELNSEVLSAAEEVDEAAAEPSSSEAELAVATAGEHEAGAGLSYEKAEEKKAVREEKARAIRLRDYFRSLLDQLISDYAHGDRGLEIREVAGGYRLATKPEYHDAVRGFVKSLKPPLKLTLQALETLAVVAYKQPVTSPEISEIRGVDSGGVLGSLMARKLITTAGRKQVIGRPILYKTTRDFLLRFGLKDINELPSIEEFEKMAGELADVEPVQEEIPMADMPRSSTESITGGNLEEEREATEPQADGDSTDVDTVPVDGRLAGLPPSYDEADDPSAREAEQQSDEAEEESR